MGSPARRLTNPITRCRDQPHYGYAGTDDGRGTDPKRLTQTSYADERMISAQSGAATFSETSQAPRLQERSKPCRLSAANRLRPAEESACELFQSRKMVTRARHTKPMAMSRTPPASKSVTSDLHLLRFRKMRTASTAKATPKTATANMTPPAPPPIRQAARLAGGAGFEFVIRCRQALPVGIHEMRDRRPHGNARGQPMRWPRGLSPQPRDVDDVLGAVGDGLGDLDSTNGRVPVLEAASSPRRTPVVWHPRCRGLEPLSG
jgi:hypothetical protein